MAEAQDLSLLLWLSRSIREQSEFEDPFRTYKRRFPRFSNAASSSSFYKYLLNENLRRMREQAENQTDRYILREYADREGLLSTAKSERESQALLSQRLGYDFLLNLFGAQAVLDRLKDFFPFASQDRQKWVVSLDDNTTASLYDFVQLMKSLYRLYIILLSLQKPEHFLKRWISGEEFLELNPHDELILISITKLSPDKITLEGAAKVLDSLGQALSVGDQYQKIRLAGVKVAQEKANLKEKELQVQTLENDVKHKEATRHEEWTLEMEKKKLEVEQLHKKVQDQEIDLEKKQSDLIKSRLENIEKTMAILEKMPPEMKKRLLDSIESEMLLIYNNPRELKAFSPEKPVDDVQFEVVDDK